jgi:hypothetical protein
MSESLMDRLDIYLSEIDYSVSPGGIDQWEMHIEFPDRTAYFSGFDTASQAIDMLIAKYPTKEFNINIRSKEWYYANEAYENTEVEL